VASVCQHFRGELSLPELYFRDDTTVVGRVHRGRNTDRSVIRGRHEGAVGATGLDDDGCASELTDEVHGQVGLVVFHTPMVHPTRHPVNPHPADVGFLTPRIRRRNGTCAAESAAVDCRTPRIPRSSGRFAADSTCVRGASLRPRCYGLG